MRSRLAAFIVAFVVALVLAYGVARAAAPDGKALYDSKCAVCHGSDGVAKPMWAKQGARNFNDAAWQKEKTDAAIADNTAQGIPEKKMPAYKDKLTADEIKAIVAHIRTLSPSE